MRYKANSCHDCIFSTMCDNPNKNPDGGYRCSRYEWKYQ
nr:MAG TPA: Integrin plexin domain [Caudoviricetes sp.]